MVAVVNQAYIADKLKKTVFNVLVLEQLVAPFSVSASDYQVDDYRIDSELFLDADDYQAVDYYTDGDLKLTDAELNVDDYQAKKYQVDLRIPAADYRTDRGVHVDSGVYQKAGQSRVHTLNGNSDTRSIKWAKGSL